MGAKAVGWRKAMNKNAVARTAEHGSLESDIEKSNEKIRREGEANHASRCRLEIDRRNDKKKEVEAIAEVWDLY